MLISIPFGTNPNFHITHCFGTTKRSETMNSFLDEYQNSNEMFSFFTLSQPPTPQVTFSPGSESTCNLVNRLPVSIVQLGVLESLYIHLS